MFSTRTSDRWESQPGKFDTMNFSWVFESSNEYGLPDIQPTDFVPTCLAAWNMPRHRDHAAETGGALHFFLDDYRFETAWSSPERLLPRATAVGAALTPDFSVWRDIPRAAQIWNTYRSRWVGAFWQMHGIEVITTAGWGSHDTYDFCFEGIPHGSIVAVSDVGMKNERADKQLFRDGMQELIFRTEPRLILSYGRLRFCDSLNLPDVREYPTYWDRRRKQLKTWESAEEGLEYPPEAIQTTACSALDAAVSERLSASAGLVAPAVAEAAAGAQRDPRAPAPEVSPGAAAAAAPRAAAAPAPP